MPLDQALDPDSGFLVPVRQWFGKGPSSHEPTGGPDITTGTKKETAMRSILLVRFGDTAHLSH